MALTPTVLGSAVPGNLRRTRITAAGDSSYATGGYVVTPAMFGYQYLSHYVCLGPTGASTVAAEGAIDPSTQKLRFLAPSGSEVANTTNVSAVSFYLEGYGN